MRNQNLEAQGSVTFRNESTQGLFQIVEFDDDTGSNSSKADENEIPLK